MCIRRYFAFTVILTTVCATAVAQTAPTLSTVRPQLDDTSSITGLLFVGRNLLLSGCGRNAGCRVTDYPLSGGKIKDHESSVNIDADSSTSLRRATDNTIIFGNQLLSVPNLHQVFMFPQHEYVYSEDGALLGYQDTQDHWCIVRTLQPNNCYAQLSGHLIALGFESALVVEVGDIRLRKIASGEERRIAGPSSCPPQGQILSASLSAVSLCDTTMLVDSSGATKLILEHFRLGFDLLQLSEDGHRLASITLGHHESRLKSVSKAAAAIITLGAGAVDEVPNQSIVDVYDLTATRAVRIRSRCYSYPVFSKRPLFALSPDGTILAVATPSALTFVPL